MFPVNSITFLDLPNDPMYVMASYLDFNSIVQVTASCSKMLEVFSDAQEWDKQTSLKFPFLYRQVNHTPREHYVLNVLGSQLRKIEQIGWRYFGAFGNIILSFPEILRGVDKVAWNSFKIDHMSAITAFASKCTNGGNYWLLTGSTDKMVYVWHSKSHTEFTKLAACEAHKRPVITLRWVGPDFLSGTSDGSLHYWVREKNGYTMQSKIERVHKASLTCLEKAMSANTKRFVFSGFSDGFITVSRLYPVKLTKLESIKAHKAQITSLCVVKEYEQVYLFSGSKERCIKIWKLDAGIGNLQLIDSIDATYDESVGVKEMKYFPSTKRLQVIDDKDLIRHWRKVGSITTWERGDDFDSPNMGLDIAFAHNNLIVKAFHSSGCYSYYRYDIQHPLPNTPTIQQHIAEIL